MNVYTSCLWSSASCLLYKWISLFSQQLSPVKFYFILSLLSWCRLFREVDLSFTPFIHHSISFLYFPHFGLFLAMLLLSIKSIFLSFASKSPCSVANEFQPLTPLLDEEPGNQNYSSECFVDRWFPSFPGSFPAQL